MATHFRMVRFCLGSLMINRSGAGFHSAALPWPQAAPTVCRTDLRWLAYGNYVRCSHALGKAFTTFRRCICKRPPTVAVKVCDNEHLICAGRIRRAFSDCAIQVQLLSPFACAEFVSCFSEYLLWFWPCRSGWRAFRLRLSIVHRTVSRRRNEQIPGT